MKLELTLSPYGGNRRTYEFCNTFVKVCSYSGSEIQVRLNTILIPKREVDFQFKFLVEDSLKLIHSKVKIIDELNNCSQVLNLGEKLHFDFNSIELRLIEKSDRPLKAKSIIDTDIDLLLVGETGTGKTTKAYELYKKSNALGPFVHINISSFSENLLESELFGHEKGAFTGAVVSKEGAFLEANNGFLFIDEIDSLPRHLQVKLLIAIDQKKIRPVGSNREVQFNTKIIFASGTSLEELLRQEKIRIDFYHRLKACFEIKLPNLRENRNLIIDFIKTFEFINDCFIDEKLKEFYKNQYWPGNFRQLKSHLNKKKCLLMDGNSFISKDIFDDDIIESSAMSFYQTAFDLSLGLSLDALKKKYISFVYKNCGENIHKATNILQISNSTFKRNFINQQ